MLGRSGKAEQGRHNKVKNSNPVRKGSIPMVLIVIVVLGIVAGAALFNSGNAARLDKKSELNQAAWIVAQAAVEEMIVKASNGKVAIPPNGSIGYLATVTAKTIGSPDVTIDPVHMVKRVIEDTTKTPDVAAERAIRQLAALVPGYYKKSNPGFALLTLAGGAPSPLAKAAIDQTGNNVEMYYDIDWRNKMLSAAAGSYDPYILKALNTAYTLSDKTTVAGKDFNEASLTEAKAKDYYEKNIKAGGNAESDTGAGTNPQHTGALALFKTLPTLSYLGPFTGAPAEATDPTKMHPTSDLDAFKKTYQDATAQLADHMQARINGCNGDFNYAIGGMLTGMGRGTPCANDSDAGEETYRKQSRDSGLTEYKEALLTLSTKVHINSGISGADQQYTAHRMIRDMNLNLISMQVAKTNLAYLHGYYNLTVQDLQYLGFLAKPQPGATASAEPTAQPANFGTMDDRYSVFSGNEQVRNAQLANCLSTPK